MSEQTVSTEAARDEFDRFCKEWDIETDVKHMDEDSVADFEKLSGRVIRAIEEGRAHITDSGGLAYILDKPVGETNEITFRVPCGRDYMAMDSYKDQQTSRKLFAFMGSLCGKDVRFLGNMVGKDIKFVQSVASLFMAS